MRRAILGIAIIACAACKEPASVAQSPIPRADSEQVLMQAVSTLKSKFQIDNSTCVEPNVAKEFIDEPLNDEFRIASEKLDKLPSQVLNELNVTNDAGSCGGMLNFFDPFYFDQTDRAGAKHRFASVISFRDCGLDCQDEYYLLFQKVGKNWNFVAKGSSLQRHRKDARKST